MHQALGQLHVQLISIDVYASKQELSSAKFHLIPWLELPNCKLMIKHNEKNQLAINWRLI